MGVTALSFSAVVNVPSGRLLGNNGVSTGPAVALTSTQVFAVLATGTPSATTYLRGDGTWSTISAGVSGSTGSTDNAVLRADGTGGATLQDSAFVIPDNFTASPNATVNHASIQATGGTTNVSVSIVPKGTGAFCLAVPNNASSGGNVRGSQAVDLQLNRGNAANVASGDWSALLGGRENKAAAQESVVLGGRYSETNAQYAISGGEWSLGNGVGSVALGSESTASAAYSCAMGQQVLASRHGMRAQAGGGFATRGDAQTVEFTLRNKTTTNSAVTLFLNGSSARLTIPSGKIMHATAHIVGSKSDGTAIAVYMRQVAIANVGGTTSLVGTVNTLGTDTAAGTSIAITADDTNDALQIAVTGVTSETWRWTAVVYGVEMAYGT
jgi:hypothetical protein